MEKEAIVTKAEFRQTENEIEVSSETTAKIARLMPKFFGLKDDPEIQWYGKGYNLVFSLTSVPQLIFKMDRVGSPDSVNHRLANIRRAEEVCKTHKLGLLMIPKAKKITVAGKTLLVEERLPIKTNESAQEQLYHDLSGLNETIKQLALFIIKTGFSDVEWRNVPILDDSPDFLGNRRIALIDLEEMQSATTGIYGNGRRRGLIGILATEQHMNSVKEIAERHKIAVSEERIAERRKELKVYNQLHQVYAQKGILQNPRQPLRVENLSTLGLKLEEKRTFFLCGMVSDAKTFPPHTRTIQTKGNNTSEFGTLSLGDAAKDVISQINDKIAKAPEEASIKGKRTLLLSVSGGGPFYYNFSCEPGCQEPGSHHHHSWMERIVNALVEKGHLFKLMTANGHGYFIQA
jgi:hypothetical protein